MYIHVYMYIERFYWPSRQAAGSVFPSERSEPCLDRHGDLAVRAGWIPRNRPVF